MKTPNIRGAKWIGILLCLVTVAVDRVTKVLTDVYHVRGTLFGGRLRWTHLHNYGAAGGILQGQRILLVVVGLAVISALVYTLWTSDILSAGFWAGWGLLTGGAVGNVFDRMVYGYVIDMFQYPGQHFVFNLSDVAIRYGTLALLLFWMIDGLSRRKSTEKSK